MEQKLLKCEMKWNMLDVWVSKSNFTFFTIPWEPIGTCPGMRAKNGVGLHDGAVSWAVSKKDTWKARASLFRPQKASATPNPSQTQSPAMKKMIVMATLQESQQNILMSCLLLFVDIQEVKTGSCIDVFYFKILQSIKKKENPFTVLPSIPVFHRNNALLLTKMS